jgi:hypothetical protein
MAHNWRHRLLDERQELAARLTRLAGFISRNEVFATLDPVDQSLLRRQRAVMLDYHAVLEDRISRLPDV